MEINKILITGAAGFIGSHVYDHFSSLYPEAEINILDKKLYTGTPLGFLLPHSSVLSIMLFFGLIGLLIFLVYVFYILYKGRKANNKLFLICLFILLNIFKSDSILYFPSFFLYLTMFVSLNKRYKVI